MSMFLSLFVKISTVTFAKKGPKIKQLLLTNFDCSQSFNLIYYLYTQCIIIYDRAGLNEGFQELPFGNSCPKPFAVFHRPIRVMFSSVIHYCDIVPWHGNYPENAFHHVSSLSCERVLWTSIMWHLSWQIYQVYHMFYLCISIDISP